MSTCPAHGRFVIENLKDRDPHTRFIYTCSWHMNVLVERTIVEDKTEVTIGINCNPDEPTCDQGAR